MFVCSNVFGVGRPHQGEASGDFIGGMPVHGDGVDVTQCYEWAS